MAFPVDRQALIVAGGILGIAVVARWLNTRTARTASGSAAVRAFLAVIRKYESAGRYNVIYGGELFTDYTRHPNKRVPFFNRATGKWDYSTAAGAYQINYPTWVFINSLASIPDFSPSSQDMAAVVLLRARGILPLIEAGKIAEAFTLAGKTWASLPGGGYKQGEKPLKVAMSDYIGELKNA